MGTQHHVPPDDPTSDPPEFGSVPEEWKLDPAVLAQKIDSMERELKRLSKGVDRIDISINAGNGTPSIKTRIAISEQAIKGLDDRVSAAHGGVRLVLVLQVFSVLLFAGLFCFAIFA